MINVLDWAEERGIIKKSQHDAMTKEFSRRIEARGLKSVSSKVRSCRGVECDESVNMTIMIEMRLHDER